ncbi:hypothetical protein BE11_03255 [Sorangium cellulosum]|nr:hypothetical protein BE11_03255 [Sorangium cellulosum]
MTIDPLDIACRDLVEVVSDYLEGALGPAELVALEAHLVICSGCAEYLALLRRVQRATRGIATTDLDPALLDRLTQALLPRRGAP